MNFTDIKFSREYSRYVSLAEDNSVISQDFYQKHDIKRGLRNHDGSGVVVGATKVSSVQGYEMIDGKLTPKEGELYYRGININEIIDGAYAENYCSLEEAAYLLLFGKLPTLVDYEQFSGVLCDLRTLPTHFVEDFILKNPSKDIMNMLQRLVISLYTFDETADSTDLKDMVIKILSMVAKLPVLTSYAYMATKHYYENQSLILHNPLPNKSSAANILHLIRHDGNYTQLEENTLDMLMTVHAEHGGGNNSAFASSVVASSGTDYYSALTSAIGSLKGPKHGGASKKVNAMILDLKQQVHDWTNKKQIRQYLNAILDKETFDKAGLIYGMGHAVYTISDPRAVILKREAKKLAKDKNLMDEYYLIENIESITIELIKERRGADYNISANVDLYSGLIFRMLEIDEALFTPLFACSRIIGWSAHILEQIRDGKIIRPAYVTMSSKLEYSTMSER